MRETDMETIGDLIQEVISNIGNAEIYRGVARKVETLCSRFPLYSDLRA
jgi:glycine/serine hydroxymethyltransferase